MKAWNKVDRAREENYNDNGSHDDEYYKNKSTNGKINQTLMLEILNHLVIHTLNDFLFVIYVYIPLPCYEHYKSKLI